MSRIFISLSLLPIALILSATVSGLWIGDYNASYAKVRAQADAAARSAAKPDIPPAGALNLASLEEPQRRFRLHFQLGLATALATVLINSLSVTYLIGTSRWVREVTEAYGLDTDYAQRSSRLKRHAFPWALIGVLSILGITALGAAADPGTLGATTASWVTPHAASALLGTCLIVWAILVQAYDLHQNAQVIDQVVDRVRQERLARGLDVEQ